MVALYPNSVTKINKHKDPSKRVVCIINVTKQSKSIPNNKIPIKMLWSS
jgi:hypothetical protein